MFSAGLQMPKQAHRLANQLQHSCCKLSKCTLSPLLQPYRQGLAYADSPILTHYPPTLASKPVKRPRGKEVKFKLPNARKRHRKGRAQCIAKLHMYLVGA